MFQLTRSLLAHIATIAGIASLGGAWFACFQGLPTTSSPTSGLKLLILFIFSLASLFGLLINLGIVWKKAKKESGESTWGELEKFTDSYETGRAKNIFYASLLTLAFLFIFFYQVDITTKQIYEKQNLYLWYLSGALIAYWVAIALLWYFVKEKVRQATTTFQLSRIHRQSKYHTSIQPE